MGGRRLPRRGWIGLLAAALFAVSLLGVATSSAQYGLYPGYPNYGNSGSGSGPGSGSTASKKKPAAKVTVKGSMGSYKFKPKKVTIKKGQTVKWSWNSDAPHNVTFSKKKHSKTTMTMSGFKLTFKKKGTFHYMCTVHLIKGTVVVQ